MESTYEKCNMAQISFRGCSKLHIPCIHTDTCTKSQLIHTTCHALGADVCAKATRLSTVFPSYLFALFGMLGAALPAVFSLTLLFRWKKDEEEYHAIPEASQHGMK